MKIPSIICLTPVYADFMPEHTMSLLSTLRACGEAGFHIEEPNGFLYQQGSLVVQARNELVEQALRTNATHFVWFDADMRFDGKDVVRMIAAMERRGALFMGAVAPTRDGDPNVHFEGGGLSMQEVRQRIDDDGVLEVDGIGLALAVTHRMLFERFADKKIQPFEEQGSGADHIAEDIMFCRRFRKTFVGKIYALADVQVGHVVRRVAQMNLATMVAWEGNET